MSTASKHGPQSVKQASTLPPIDNPLIEEEDDEQDKRKATSPPAGNLSPNNTTSSNNKKDPPDAKQQSQSSQQKKTNTTIPTEILSLLEENFAKAKKLSTAKSKIVKSLLPLPQCFGVTPWGLYCVSCARESPRHHQAYCVSCARESSRHHQAVNHQAVDHRADALLTHWNIHHGGYFTFSTRAADIELFLRVAHKERKAMQDKKLAKPYLTAPVQVFECTCGRLFSHYIYYRKHTEESMLCEFDASREKTMFRTICGRLVSLAEVKAKLDAQQVLQGFRLIPADEKKSEDDEAGKKRKRKESRPKRPPKKPSSTTRSLQTFMSQFLGGR